MEHEDGDKDAEEENYITGEEVVDILLNNRDFRESRNSN